ncbi:conserved hypothetical protein [Candidatus Sulfopaludibacter sp. SbA3]|nr:conserved hypothetical protein [Candidatus Sulfopaludibacter sp. SbA3]
MIPGIAPEWTNYNPADPGVTLIELFAYVTEVLIYRLNQITDDDLLAYLKLLNGPDWQLAPGADPAVEMKQAILALDTPQRAVTPEDFETMALAADPGVARAHAVPDCYLWAPHRGARENRPGHVSVVIVPKDASDPNEAALVVEAVRKFLEPRRLLATRLHVGTPRYVKARVRLTVTMQPGASEAYVRDEAIRRMRRFFDPVSGGADGQGWPFGRAVYVSEIYEMLDAIPEVDFVSHSVDSASGRTLDELIAPESPERIQRSSTGDVIALLLDPDELIQPEIDEDEIVMAEMHPPGRKV